MKKSSVKKLNECVRRLSRIEKKYQKVGREGQLVVALLRQVETDLGANLGECLKIDRWNHDYESLTEMYGTAEPLAEIIDKISVFDMGTMIDTLRRIAENGPSSVPATPLQGHLDSATSAPDLDSPPMKITLRAHVDTQLAQSALRTAMESLSDRDAGRSAGMNCEDEGCPYFGKPHLHIKTDDLLSRVPDKTEPEDLPAYADLVQARTIPEPYPRVTFEFIEPDWQPAMNLPHAVGDNLLQFANWFISENTAGEGTEVILNIKLKVDIRESGNILSKFTANFE